MRVLCITQYIGKIYYNIKVDRLHLGGVKNPGRPFQCTQCIVP